MSIETVIKKRSDKKELRLAGALVKSRAEYEQSGAKYLGSVGTAYKQGYYTIAGCLRLGKPATQEELNHVEFFAMMKNCETDLCLHKDGKYVRPCVPVFYRGIPEGKQE